jgi:hypothetical protein
MNKRTKRMLGFMALAAGAAGTAFIGARKMQIRRKKTVPPLWARPGMMLTFRAELMPGRDPELRTFRVQELLPNGRVTLLDRIGEHDEREFEKAR